jgi:hypothetical protein
VENEQATQAMAQATAHAEKAVLEAANKQGKEIRSGSNCPANQQPTPCAFANPQSTTAVTVGHMVSM